MNIFQRLKASLRLWEAVRKADEAHRETGERYYVMPADGCRLVIMDRFNFRKLKQKGYVTRKAYIRDLEVESFYFTPYRNGSCPIAPHIKKMKRRQFFRWYEDCIRNSKGRKKE